ncbi:Modification methylase HhaI [Fusobacterium sp. DD29]|uniref:DNA cytosine methyltransferase n=1 Tax=unclassified Fusobacterium TaxID=2648384 RepID=UPI001B8B5FEF|nr:MULTISPECIES: DNA (cytosine-5-)-methyltransferase [unclassified Fusobacterium]MBR8750420.1 Modification methylase HhaI [Fusobacterium sp. DD29]MBR8762661.1 Modification methylase HhaI [Fusobacterium sp. DD25]MBR8768682.1 Modification methylase HhaI [Fusobacterium sp. DD43]MBR8772755.1 Modification methylase HhaI [Fusobacterium sp. DD40]MBR8776964.1 Modification methylase HhaI [Fusobacterium sp. DD17]
MIKFVELFGGIGAPRKALQNLGIPFKSVDYVEIDSNAVKSYNAIFDEHYKPCDINSYIPKDIKIDLLVHGSPCQDFSIAGKQLGGEQGSGTRSSLMFKTLEIIEQMGNNKPEVIIWENVKNVLSPKMRNAFIKYLLKLEQLGYKNKYRVLNSLDFGIPQSRNRIYVVSTLSKEFSFNNLKTKELKPIKEFMSDYKEKHLVTQPSMLKKINAKNHTTVIIKDYCTCITTKQVRSPNSGVFKLADNKYRYLTELECWRLMGFDDKDYYAAAKVHKVKDKFQSSIMYKQAGNSIVVNVLQEIFLELFMNKANKTELF